jgi:hypothetical protein
MMKEFFWWASRDPVNFILSLTLLIVGVLFIIHLVGSMGKRIRQRRHRK